MKTSTQPNKTGADQADASSGPLLVSLIVSTYRRLDMLRNALESLRELEVRNGLEYEVLVVDNDPACSAGELVAALQPEWINTRSLRYLHESQPGLSHVRNRGMDEARGQIIGFLDDDIFISKNWLLDVIDCFNKTGADCVGARTVVHWDGEPEATVRACQDQLVDNAIEMGQFEVRGAWLPGGGNMAIRRSVIEDGFRFDHGLGRVGTVLLSGEDTEAMRRLRDGGKRIWFCGSAVMHHRTSGERLKASYYVRRAYWMGISYALVDQRLRGKAHQVASAIARLVKLALVTSPAWLLARLRRDAVRQLLLRVSMARHWGYIHITFRAGKLLEQALPKKN